MPDPANNRFVIIRFALTRERELKLRCIWVLYSQIAFALTRGRELK